MNNIFICFKAEKNGLTFTDKAEDVVIATNGSVKDGKGSAAYTMHTSATQGTMRAVLPVDGPPNHLTSYRTELFGILGALLLLKNLLSQHGDTWEKLSALLWCDNEAALRKFNALAGTAHYSISAANGTDSDVLHDLRCIKASLPIEVTARWVKSHQAECTTREARLNRIADRLAATQHQVQGPWRSQPTSTMLPNT